MIRPSTLTPRQSPSNDSGLGRQSRPSPVIPLGKGEYSLREWRCSRSSARLFDAVACVTEQAGDAATQRGHCDDSDNGDQSHQ